MHRKGLLLLWFTLFTICTIHFTQAGIYRRYVRRNRPRPREPLPLPMIPHDHFARREFQVYVPNPWPTFLFRKTRSSPWPFQPFGFQQPRMARRFRHPNERQDTVPNFHHQPTQHQYSLGPQMTPRYSMSSTPFSAWRPLGYGNPIDRDPTFDYAPPSVERVRFHTEGHNRRTTARSNTLPTPYTNRPPPPPPGFSKRPSLWKMLAHKQRPKRPFHPFQRHPQSFPTHHHSRPPIRNQLFPEEAEIFPHMPNMVYFRPNDVMTSSRRPGQGPPMGFPSRRPGPPGRPSELIEAGKDDVISGSVSDTSLFSGEATANSELSTVTVDKPRRSGGNKNKEYLFTVVGYKGPTSFPPPPPPPPASSTLATTKKPPTVLHAVKTTPVTITTTHNSVVKPFEPTESLEHHNHKNDSDHSQDDDDSVEESVHFEKVVKGKSEKKQSSPSITKGKESDENSKLDKLNMIPPNPIFPNSFNILESVKDDENEDSEMVIDPENEIPGTVIEIPSAVKPARPVFNNAVRKAPISESYKTSTSISVSMSKTDDIQIPTKAPKYKTTSTPATTTTFKSKSKSSTTTAASTSTTSTTTQATTPKSTKFPRLPTMPTYKKKPTPVYARKNNKNAPNGPLSKYSSSSSSSSLAKEMNGSGEIVVITAGRSKVKEYKPQFIGDSSQLLSFDKVAEGSSTVHTSSEVTSTSSPSSTTTTKSPLQEFDPMQLLHSWFTKSD